jgi:thiol-disulfide isomerase/thioredoxin
MTIGITLIDSTTDSLTVSWPEIPGAERYVLQYRKAAAGDGEFETLSDKLTTPQARKRNLLDEEGTGFVFRVGAIVASANDSEPSSWTSHSEPFCLLTADQDTNRMNAPKAFLGGSNASLRITWTPTAAAADNDADAYELQMRENRAGADWTTIAASFKGTEVRKKNLTSQHGYQFRVRTVGKTAFFSSPSEPVVALGYSDGMKQLFRSLEHGTLLQKVNQAPIPVTDALGGKEFVLLYASAHWCGPCRQFTPKLTQWYQSLGPNSTVEVVFLSADHDANGFKSYYKDMPWLAVDYDDDAREQLMAHIRVSGIPRLAVLDGRTGRIVEDNAVGKPLDVNRWRGLAGL